VNKKQNRIIAIIPARGGSKGLPGKNIKPLLGKPLIAWTIEQAKKSKYIDKLIVSTDYPEIAEISKTYGAEVPFLRPAEYASDDAPVVRAVFHALNWFENKGEFFDTIVLLETTSPLRRENDIDNAIELLLGNMERADAVVGAAKIESDTHHPYGSVKKIEKGYLGPFIENQKFFAQRHDLPVAYSIYGGMYLTKIEALKKYNSFYPEKTLPYFVERWQMYEIDDIYDFLCVEAILKYRLEQKL